MRSISEELERAGADFRNAANGLSDRTWDTMSPEPRSERRMLVSAISAATLLLVSVPMLLLGGRQSPDAAQGSPAATSPPVTSDLPPTSAEGAATGSTSPDELQVSGDLPFLLLEADGWVMVRHNEQSHQPYQAEEPFVFRPAGADIGAPTFVAAVFETTDTVGWGAGEGAERIELDGRVASITADFILPAGHVAGIQFDNGTLIVVQGYGMDRITFVDAATQITLTPDGDPTVVPPPGFERVVLPAPHQGTVTYRESADAGPGEANAEVRIWSGTMADVELQVLNRAIEALSVRAITIDGAAAVVALEADDLHRVFVVGGDDGYVIEIDLNPFVDSATDADLDALLALIRRVDLDTFETALPEGSVTGATADSVVAEMLADIPTPTGFDPAGLGAIGDRYQVGARIAGAMTCAWIDQRVDATADGDTEAATAAVNALVSP